MACEPTPCPDPVSVPKGGPLFVCVDGDPDVLTATEYCRGPWSPDTLHGGPVVGILARAVERAVAGPELLCSRLTVEMLRPVPLGVLHLSATVVKPGRRTMLVEGLITADGIAVARASSQWIAHDPMAAPVPGPVPERPGTSADPRGTGEFDYPAPGYNCDTSDLRYVVGSHESSGPGTTWIRLLSPLVEGEVTSPFAAVATVSDLAAAAGWEEPPDGGSYINPDVTLQLLRRPRGPWLAVSAAVQHGGNRAALLDAVVYDDHGPLGRVLQSLVEAPTALPSVQTIFRSAQPLAPPRQESQGTGTAASSPHRGQG